MPTKLGSVFIGLVFTSINVAYTHYKLNSYNVDINVPVTTTDTTKKPLVPQKQSVPNALIPKTPKKKKKVRKRDMYHWYCRRHKKFHWTYKAPKYKVKRKYENIVLPLKNPMYTKYTQPLDSAITNDSALNTFVKKWLGARYVWGGMSNRGVDCSGFSKLLYKEVFKMELPRTARQQYNSALLIKQDYLETGDLVFFRTKTRTTWHVGVYLTKGYYIHAATHKKGVIISHIQKQGKYERFVGSGKIFKVIPNNLPLPHGT